MMMRLETITKDFTEKLRKASPARQRAATLVACQIALQAAQIDLTVVSESLVLLQQKSTLPKEHVKKLNAIAAQLDEEYFDMQERVESEPASASASLLLFAKARAVSALAYAGGDDALDAAMEAIYEASTAVENSSQFFDAVLLVL